MQYGNPYYNYPPPYQQIQPYQDRLAQLQNNYQQVMPQQPIQQPVPQMQQIPMIQGQMVDGIDTVKAKDVDMSGNPVYYPKTDGTEVYRKQLQADGRSRIFTYRLVNENEQQPTEQTDNIGDKLNQILNRLSDIENLLPTQMSVTNEPSKSQKGGNQR